jgi:tetratricopeptide (TPR) repeat protein
VRLACFALPAAIVLAGCAEPTVTRIVDGRAEAGRFISAAAYALFARGAAAEVAGNLGGALRAFELAAAEDPQSPEIWTRLGDLHCRSVAEGAGHDGGQPHAGVPPRAVDAFARAHAADPSFGPLYRERARCLSRFGDLHGALEDAERALALDPEDVDTALVRATILERVGRRDEARRALRSVTVRRPAATEAWILLRDLAERSGDVTLAGECAEHLRPLAAAPDHPAAQLPELAPLAAIDRALVAGDLAEARRRALKQRLPGAEVALRAVALGLSSLAREQAELVLGADPADASARIALLAAADLRGDMEALGLLMRTMPRRSASPSPLARWLFAEVLRRRVGAEAALAWLGPTAAAGEGDPLLAATEKRVRAALSVP